MQSFGQGLAAAAALVLASVLASCGGAKEGGAGEKAAEAAATDEISDTEIREADLDMPDISIADALPQDPAGKLAADDRTGAGALAVDPLAGDYPEAPAPAAPPAPAPQPAG